MQVAWIPQKGINSRHYLPRLLHIPKGEFRALCFPFMGLPSLGTGTFEVGIVEEFLATAIMSTARLGAAANTATPWFSILLTHNHRRRDQAGNVIEIVQRQLLPQPMHFEIISGKASNPGQLRTPYLFAKGDSITCEVQNASFISNAGKLNPFVVQATGAGNAGKYVPADIFVALWGVRPD